jgi:hypothetical protein
MQDATMRVQLASISRVQLSSPLNERVIDSDPENSVSLVRLLLNRYILLLWLAIDGLDTSLQNWIKRHCIHRHPIYLSWAFVKFSSLVYGPSHSACQSRLNFVAISILGQISAIDCNQAHLHHHPRPSNLALPFLQRQRDFRVHNGPSSNILSPVVSIHRCATRGGQIEG